MTDDVKCAEGPTPFSSLMLPPFIVQALDEAGIVNCSPVQLSAIPPARFGMGAWFGVHHSFADFSIGRCDRSGEEWDR